MEHPVRESGYGEGCGIEEEEEEEWSNVHLAEGGGLYGKKQLAQLLAPDPLQQ